MKILRNDSNSHKGVWNNKNYYCENCRKFVEVTLHNEVLCGKVKDKEYFYSGIVARCENCRKEVYVPRVNDRNLEMLYNEYREHNDIISLEMLREIPKKYGLKNKQISRMLGWEDTDFKRYYDGDIPSKERSDVLIKLHNDPAYCEQLLKPSKL